jgi:hypothetical protein
MRHVHIDGKPKQRDRKLLEKCLHCDAPAGEPCFNEYAEQYWCPSDDCDQMYETARDAMNCVMHRRS